MASAGVPIRTIQAWMGHAQQTTTEVYSHNAPNPMNEQQLIDRAFSPQMTAVADG
jgi:integrase